MAQIIRNVKVGDRFTVNAKTNGFEYGIIVESISEEKIYMMKKSDTLNANM